MYPTPLNEKSLTQLHTTIVCRARSALATVRMLGIVSPFGGLSFSLVEEELREIVDAAEQAERLERHIGQVLAGMRLPASFRDGGVR